MLSGTDADILNSVVRLRTATKDQIRRQVGFSSEYIGYLCRELIRKGYLDFSRGHYFLVRKGKKTLLAEETPQVDRKLLKEIAGAVGREISGELKKTVKGIKIPVRQITGTGSEEATGREAVKIKTDCELPVEDESLVLESNINKVGAKLEKEKSDIDRSVELFRKLAGTGKK